MDFSLERIHFISKQTNDIGFYNDGYHARVSSRMEASIAGFHMLVHELTHAASSEIKRNRLNGEAFGGGVLSKVDLDNPIITSLPVLVEGIEKESERVIHINLNNGLNEAITEEIAVAIVSKKVDDIRQLDFFSEYNEKSFQEGTIFYNYFDSNNPFISYLKGNLSGFRDIDSYYGKGSLSFYL